MIKKTKSLKDKFDNIVFIIEFEITDYYIDFKVLNVDSYDVDSYKPKDTSPYLEGTIKWDGCSHLHFYDDDLHLCGKSNWEMHILLLDTLWSFCSKNIKFFDEKVAR